MPDLPPKTVALGFRPRRLPSSARRSVRASSTSRSAAASARARGSWAWCDLTHRYPTQVGAKMMPAAAMAEFTVRRTRRLAVCRKPAPSRGARRTSGRTMARAHPMRIAVIGPAIAIHRIAIATSPSRGQSAQVPITMASTTSATDSQVRYRRPSVRGSRKSCWNATSVSAALAGGSRRAVASRRTNAGASSVSGNPPTSTGQGRGLALPGSSRGQRSRGVSSSTDPAANSPVTTLGMASSSQGRSDGGSRPRVAKAQSPASARAKFHAMPTAPSRRSSTRSRARLGMPGGARSADGELIRRGSGRCEGWWCAESRWWPRRPAGSAGATADRAAARG
jgi:hypothetical protein